MNVAINETTMAVLAIACLLVGGMGAIGLRVYLVRISPRHVSQHPPGRHRRDERPLRPVEAPVARRAETRRRVAR